MVPVESDAVPGGWADRSLSRVPPEEVVDAVTRIQYVPDEEGLPNSKMLVALPTSLNVFVDLEYREEKGFLPDLWVPAEDALNYAVAAVREGTIATSQSYREEISGVAFIPEEPTMRDRVFSLLPIIATVLYGVVFVYFNRQRGMYFFILSGVVMAALGYFLVSREPLLGYACILVGVEYLLISLYKWRKAIK